VPQKGATKPPAVLLKPQAAATGKRANRLRAVTTAAAILAARNERHRKTAPNTRTASFKLRLANGKVRTSRYFLKKKCTGANGLDMQFTDSNFSPATGEFSISYGDTESGIGTTTESAYFDHANRPFAETTLIDTLGPFSASVEFSTLTIEKAVDKASPKKCFR